MWEGVIFVGEWLKPRKKEMYQPVREGEYHNLKAPLGHLLKLSFGFSHSLSLQTKWYTAYMYTYRDMIIWYMYNDINANFRIQILVNCLP